MNSNLQLLLLVIFAFTVNCSFTGHRKSHFKSEKEKSVKIVNYVFKRDNIFQVSQIGVKNIKLEPYADWVAKSLWNGDDYNSTGWSTLEIETNENSKDFDQAFGAGFVEGSVTRDHIALHLRNTVGDFCKDSSALCKKLETFLISNFKWMNDNINKNPHDDYWHQVNLAMAQFSGLYHGYYNITRQITHTHNILTMMISDIKPYLNLLALQLNGDLSEVLASITGLSDPFNAGSCSALIKLLPNNENVFVSHNTWTVYESMLRILKKYKFNYHFCDLDLNCKPPVICPGSEISFSSYPGILVSIDDFYTIKSHLVVQETTIGNANTDLWKYVTPQTNLYWIRIIVANRLSSTGGDWVKWFSMHNSGTYNNEWMIVDFKQFTPGEELKDGFLTVLEQIPGQTPWKDMTPLLRNQTYWPSYNLAYFPEVYNISGTYDSFVQYGSFFSYEESPRASIFRRDHGKVVDMDSMIKLMRYNDYTHDPLSACDCSPPYSGENTISARSDLNPADGKYAFDALGHRDHGATDMKVTDYKMSQNLDFIAISGPTHGYPNIPVFAWSEADFGNTTNHFGHPDKWDFAPLLTKWKF